MPDPRQITDLPVATQADNADLVLLRQGLFDKQCEVSFIRAGTLLAANNLSDVVSASTARTNLGVPSNAQALLVANNLSDIADAATARTNLGIDTSDFLESANNLSDLTDTTAARTNLSVPSNAEALLGANNLDDLNNAATARTNLSVAALADTVLTNATRDMNHTLLQRPQFQNYTELRVADGNISTTHTFDLSAGNVRTAAVTANVTIAFGSPAATGQSNGFILFLTNGGDFTVTWPASIVWPNGTAPTLTSGGTDMLTFITTDNGTTWYGTAVGLDFS